MVIICFKIILSYLWIVSFLREYLTRLVILLLNSCLEITYTYVCLIQNSLIRFLITSHPSNELQTVVVFLSNVCKLCWIKDKITRFFGVHLMRPTHPSVFINKSKDEENFFEWFIRHRTGNMLIPNAHPTLKSRHASIGWFEKFPPCHPLVSRWASLFYRKLRGRSVK